MFDIIISTRDKLDMQGSDIKTGTNVSSSHYSPQNKICVMQLLI